MCFSFICTFWKYLSHLIDDSLWSLIAPNYCNGTQQSPINIVSADAQANKNLTEFTFYNYASTTTLKYIQNTDNTGEGRSRAGQGRGGGGGVGDEPIKQN